MRAKPNAQRAMVLALVMLALVAVGVGLTRLRTETGPESFLPAGDPALRALQDSARSFGGDPILVLAESAKPQQLLGSEQLPRLLALEGELSRLPDVAVVYGPATVLNQIAGASQQMLATLAGHRDALAAQARATARRDGATKKETAAAVQRSLAAFDNRYGSLLVRGLPAGLPTLRNPGFVRQVIFDSAGAPKPQWKFVVPRANTVAVLVRPREGLDQEGTARLVGAVTRTVDQAGLATSRLTVTGVPAVTAGLGRQVRREVPLLGALAVALIGCCYWFVPWIRERRKRLIPLATTLCATAITLSVFGWLSHPLSLGVVAFLPILVGIASDYPAYLAHPGPRRRVVVAACASAASFASLAISPAPFVRDLGLALAFGLLLAVGLGLVVGDRLRTSGPIPEPAEPSARRRDSGSARLTAPQRWSALAAAVGVAAIGWLALPRLDIESQPDKLAVGLPALDGIRHAEQVLGGSGEVQLVLQGPDVLAPEALAWMSRADTKIAVEHGDELKAIVSPSSLLKFLGPSPTTEEVAAGVALLPAYLTGSVVRDDHQRATMSFLLALHDLRDQDRILKEVRASIPPAPKGYDVELVGLPVVAARGYELISGSVYLTSTIGIVSAGLVLLVALRRRSDALRAVLAATAATGWGLAAVVAFGMSLTPLTLALGSMTTATACEFTVMLGGQARLGHSRMNRTVAAAALAAAMGFAALSASSLAMVREFGLLLAGSVVLSYAAARLVVVLLPQPSAPQSETKLQCPPLVMSQR
jgi:predicted RND superfamily exporter protein